MTGSRVRAPHREISPLSIPVQLVRFSSSGRFPGQDGYVSKSARAIRQRFLASKYPYVRPVRNGLVLKTQERRRVPGSGVAE